jgi:hypothetical protein
MACATWPGMCGNGVRRRYRASMNAYRLKGHHGGCHPPVDMSYVVGPGSVPSRHISVAPTGVSNVMSNAGATRTVVRPLGSGALSLLPTTRALRAFDRSLRRRYTAGTISVWVAARFVCATRTALSEMVIPSEGGPVVARTRPRMSGMSPTVPLYRRRASSLRRERFSTPDLLPVMPFPT